MNALQSLFRRAQPQKAGTEQMPPAAPVELAESELKQVAGGLPWHPTNTGLTTGSDSSPSAAS